MVWYMRMHTKIVFYHYNKSCIYSYQSHGIFHWAVFSITDVDQGDEILDN